MDSKINIGKIIKTKRLELNLTSSFVAEKVGITRPTLSSIENGHLSCSFATILKLLDFLNINFKIQNNNVESFDTRKRATRINTMLKKKINRFVIMCVEQYAIFSKEASNIVYKEMSRKGVVQDLENNYDDLHGMSALYLNEYIKSLLEN